MLHVEPSKGEYLVEFFDVEFKRFVPRDFKATRARIELCVLIHAGFFRRSHASVVLALERHKNIRMWRGFSE
jgi:hypothetical protein